MNALRQMFQYIAGAVNRIFSPTDDAYPATGVQPYSGDPYHGGSEAEV